MNISEKFEEITIANGACFIVWDIGFIADKPLLCLLAAIGACLALGFVLFTALRHWRTAEETTRVAATKEMIHQAVFTGCIVAMYGAIC